MDDEILINEAKASETAKRIADPVTRNMVMFAIAEARMRAMRRVGQAESDWRAGLPETPFDMEFFASVVAELFAKTDIVRAVLNGESLAAASGWDV